MFLRRRRSVMPSEEHSLADGSEYACGFCGAGIEALGLDPLALNIVEGFRGGCELDAPAGSTIYAHRACLVKRLEPELRELMEH